jgi:hypothetical protein
MCAPAKDKDARKRDGIQLGLVPVVAQAIAAFQILPLEHHAHLAVVAQDYLHQRSVFRGRRKLLMFIRMEVSPLMQTTSRARTVLAYPHRLAGSSFHRATT